MKLDDKVSAITSDGKNVFAASEEGNKIYKVASDNSVQTIALDRSKKAPLKKIIAHNETIYRATSNSVMKVRSE